MSSDPREPSELDAALAAANAARETGDDARIKGAEAALRLALLATPTQDIDANKKTVAEIVGCLVEPDEQGVSTLTAFEFGRPLVRWFTLLPDGQFVWEQSGEGDESG